jgi:hypothetical protein
MGICLRGRNSILSKYACRSLMLSSERQPFSWGLRIH